MAELKPELDYVLVEEEKGNEKSEGGIFLPQSAQEGGVKFGDVIRTGPGKYENGTFVEVGFEEGQRVAWKDYNEIEVRFQGREYTMVPAGSIIATVE